jgi:filamentous hemagglutinin family protein
MTTQTTGERGGLVVRGLVGGATLVMAAMPAGAGPEGASVVRGNVQFDRNGAHTTITASNNSIINYRSFNVGSSEAVRFVQPGADARVLNRITSGSPTTIEGSLSANGRVYFINPAGVLFTPSAVVDVGQLFAAAGDMSNQDFLRGNDRVTNLRGEVVNQGLIRAGAVALLGQKVGNSGSIFAPEGSVVMATGDSLMVGRRGQRIWAKIEAAGRPVSEVRPIAGKGGREAAADAARDRRAALAKGVIAKDAFAAAVWNTGTVKAREVHVETTGEVRAAGLIDASSSTSVGGNVRLLGEQVIVSGVVDASGATGGGEVLIGGNFQGRGAERNAARTAVTREGVVRADATVAGNGGRVIVWADDRTNFAGHISAKGGPSGGDGGFVEVSGKERLGFWGFVDLTAPKGRAGSLLLDPRDITIQTGGDAVLPADPLDFGSPDDTTDLTIDPIAITNISNTGALVTLQANRDITVQSAIVTSAAGTGGAINMDAGRNITINANITTDDGALNLSANDSDANAGVRGAGAGRIIFGTGGSVNAGAGLVTMTVDAIGVQAGDSTIGQVTSTGFVFSSPGGASFAGTLAAGSGDVSISAGGNVTQSAAMSGAGLRLVGSSGADFTLENSGNNFTTLAASLGTGDLSYADADALTVGTVGLTTGIAAGSATIASDALTVATGASVDATGGTVTLISDSFTLDGTVVGANVVVAPRTDGASFGVASPTGTVLFSLANLGQVTATNSLTFGSSATGQATGQLTTGLLNLSVLNVHLRLIGSGIELADALTLGGTRNLTLESSGTITQGGTADISAAGLRFLGGAGSDFMLNNAGNDVTTIAAAVGGGSISYRDADGLTVGTVDGTAGLVMGTGSATLIAGGPLDQSAAITAGTLDARTSNDTGAAITLTHTGNDVDNVSLLALQTGGSPPAANGAISFVDSDGFEIDQVRTASSASLAGSGDITQDGEIEANGLTVVTRSDSQGADILLNDLIDPLTPGNDVTGAVVLRTETLGGARQTANITFHNGLATQLADVFTDGNATILSGAAVSQTGPLLVAGILDVTTRNASGASISLQTSANEASRVRMRVQADDGTYTVPGEIRYQSSSGFRAELLRASSADGNILINAGGQVTQETDDQIIGNRLTIQGTGGYALDSGLNDANELTGSSDGSIEFRDADDLDITAGGLASTSGGVTIFADEMDVLGTVSGSAITIDRSTTAVSQIGLGGASGQLQLTEAELQLLSTTAGGGLVTIGSRSGAALAANALSLGATNYDLSLEGSSITLAGLTLATNRDLELASDGTITGSGGIVVDELLVDATGAGGATLASGANDVTSVSYVGGQGFSFRDADGFDVLQIQSGTSGAVTLEAGALVAQSGQIRGGELTLLGAGPFELDSVTTNDVASLTATTTGDVSFRDANNLIINSVSMGTSTLSLRTAGTLTQADELTLNGRIVAGALELNTSGETTLRNGFNDVDVLTAVGGAVLNYVDADALEIGAAGVDRGSSAVTIRSGGLLTITGPVTGSTVTLGAGGGFTGLGAISGSQSVTFAPTGATGVSIGIDGAAGVVQIPLATLLAVSNSTPTVNVGDLDAGLITGPANLDLSSRTWNLSLRGDGIALNGLNLSGAGRTLTLTSNGGNVTQVDSGMITAANLRVGGTGDFALDGLGNNFATLAGTVDGDLTVNDTGDGMEVVAGGLEADNITIDSDAGLTQNNPSGTITTGVLTLNGTGPFELGEIDNNIGVLAGDLSGLVDVRDDDGFALANLTATNATFRIGSGGAVTQNAGTLDVSGLVQLIGAGNFTLANPTNRLNRVTGTGLGAVSLLDSVGTLVLGDLAATSIAVASNTSVSQDGFLQTGLLSLDGSGTFTLINPGNDVTQLASGAGLSRVVDFKDTLGGFQLLDFRATDLTLRSNGGVSQADGTDLRVSDELVLTDGGSFALSNVGNQLATVSGIGGLGAVSIGDDEGNLTLGAISASSISVRRGAAGAVDQTGVLSTGLLTLDGLGNFTLDSQENSVDTLLAQVQGDLRLRDGNGFRINQLNAANATLSSGAGTVDQTGTINLNGTGTLELLGDALFQLENLSNTVGTLSGTFSNRVEFAQTSGYQLGQLTGGDLDLTTGAASSVGQQGGASFNVDDLVVSGGTFMLANSGNQVASFQANTGGDVDVALANGFDVVSITGRNVSLRGGGTVTQSGAIVADRLSLSGSNAFQLANTGNDVNALAGDVDGAGTRLASVSFTDADGFTVDGLDVLGNATLSATTGSIARGGGAIAVGQLLTVEAVDGVLLQGTNNQIARLNARATAGGVLVDNAGNLLLENLDAAADSYVDSEATLGVKGTARVAGGGLRLEGATVRLADGGDANLSLTRSGNSLGRLVVRSTDVATIVIAGNVLMDTRAGLVVSDNGAWVSGLDGTVWLDGRISAASAGSGSLTINTPVLQGVDAEVGETLPLVLFTRSSGGLPPVRLGLISINWNVDADNGKNSLASRYATVVAGRSVDANGQLESTFDSANGTGLSLAATEVRFGGGQRLVVFGNAKLDAGTLTLVDTVVRGSLTLVNTGTLNFAPHKTSSPGHRRSPFPNQTDQNGNDRVAVSVVITEKFLSDGTPPAQPSAPDGRAEISRGDASGDGSASAINIASTANLRFTQLVDRVRTFVGTSSVDANGVSGVFVSDGNEARVGFVDVQGTSTGNAGELLASLAQVDLPDLEAEPSQISEDIRELLGKVGIYVKSETEATRDRELVGYRGQDGTWRVFNDTPRSAGDVVRDSERRVSMERFASTRLRDLVSEGVLGVLLAADAPDASEESRRLADLSRSGVSDSWARFKGDDEEFTSGDGVAFLGWLRTQAASGDEQAAATLRVLGEIRRSHERLDDMGFTSAEVQAPRRAIVQLLVLDQAALESAVSEAVSSGDWTGADRTSATSGSVPAARPANRPVSDPVGAEKGPFDVDD